MYTHIEDTQNIELAPDLYIYELNNMVPRRLWNIEIYVSLFLIDEDKDDSAKY